jgi:hypothetical protein
LQIFLFKNKIPSSRHQITKNSQISIFNDSNILIFGHCNLFGICGLWFEILEFWYLEFTQYYNSNDAIKKQV